MDWTLITHWRSPLSLPHAYAISPHMFFPFEQANLVLSFDFDLIVGLAFV